jgi:hypothetical protein
MIFSDIRRVLREHRCAGPERPDAARTTNMETDARFSGPRTRHCSIRVMAGQFGEPSIGLARPIATSPGAGTQWLRPIRGAPCSRVHPSRSRPAFASVSLGSTESRSSMERATVGSTRSTSPIGDRGRRSSVRWEFPRSQCVFAGRTRIAVQKDTRGPWFFCPLGIANTWCPCARALC